MLAICYLSCLGTLRPSHRLHSIMTSGEAQPVFLMRQDYPQIIINYYLASSKISTTNRYLSFLTFWISWFLCLRLSKQSNMLPCVNPTILVVCCCNGKLLIGQHLTLQASDWLSPSLFVMLMSDSDLLMTSD